MTVFLLVRHGHTAWIGHGVPGRLPGITLTQHGREEVTQLAERLAKFSVRAIYSSPLERTQETATILAQYLNAPVHTSEPLIELEVGEWAGKTLAELSTLPIWKDYTYRRSSVNIHGIEPFQQVQQRVVNEIERLRGIHANEIIVLVSHGDVLKAAVMYYIGMDVDLHYRMEISTASVSILTFQQNEPQLLLLNHTGDLPALP